MYVKTLAFVQNLYNVVRASFSLDTDSLLIISAANSTYLSHVKHTNLMMVSSVSIHIAGWIILDINQLGLEHPDFM